MNSFHWPNPETMRIRHDSDGDDDDTPQRLIVHAAQHSASNHPRVKVARVWHATIVTTFAIAVIGGLAALQQWPAHLTLAALGAATGLWAVGALKR
jgi:hypothetical protein